MFSPVSLEDKKRGGGSEIAIDNRYNWLKTQGLLNKYYLDLESRLTTITKHFRKRIHAVNPNLILGNLNYVNTWFFRGMARGMGTKSLPALVAAESPTYSKGYHSFVDKECKRFKDEGFYVLYVPGIWDVQFFPEDLSWHCYNLAMHSDGYWDFTIRGLYKGLLPDFYAKLMQKSHGNISEYWNAFTIANDEIEKKTKAGDKYHSTLDREVVNLAVGKEVVSEVEPEKGSISDLTDGSVW